MNWNGDIFLARSDDYTVETQYSGRGAHHIVRYREDIIGYPQELAKADALCEEHRRKLQPMNGSVGY